MDVVFGVILAKPTNIRGKKETKDLKVDSIRHFT